MSPVPTHLNTGRMRVIEKQVRDAVRNGETIVYRVTPVYRGNDKVPAQIINQAEGSGATSFQDFTYVLDNIPRP